MRVRQVRAEDWEALRELRLRALADAPEAFAATHAQEAAFPEASSRPATASRCRPGPTSANPSSAWSCSPAP